MAKVKPYRAGEKRIIHHLALALVAAEIESNVIKPQYEKETGKSYVAKDGYLDTYLSSDIEVKRAWKALKKEVQQVRADYLKYAKSESTND